MNERRIDIREMIWNMILGWRLLLVCAILFAIICEPVMYYRDLKAYDSALLQQQATLNPEEKEDEEGEFSADEKSGIKMAVSLQQAIDRNQTYMNDSILMNIDPYNEPVLLLRYYVDTDYHFNYLEDNQPDYTQAVVAAYEEYARSGELAQKVTEALALDCDSSVVQELVTVPNDTQAAMVGVNIVYTDEDTLQEIAKVVETELEAQTDRIASDIGSHTLKFLSQTITVRKDWNLAGQQQSCINMLNTYRTQLNTLKTNLTDNQKAYLNYLDVAEAVGDENAEDAAPEVVLVKPGFSFKYAIYGIVMGIFLGACWIVCKMLFTSKLQSCDELNKVYGLRLFGKLDSEKKISSIDQALLRIKNRHQKQMSGEERLHMAVSNLALTCRQDGITRIYVTGSEIEKVSDGIREAISAQLKNAGVEAVFGSAICYDAQSLQSMTDVGHAVILEQTGLSVYNEIEKEIRLMKEVQVKVLGGIGIGM